MVTITANQLHNDDADARIFMRKISAFVVCTRLNFVNSVCTRTYNYACFDLSNKNIVYSFFFAADIVVVATTAGCCYGCAHDIFVRTFSIADKT